MLRVARIVPEFWAQTTPENGATPCAQRNKEFFARGVFYLLSCCTNVVVRRVGYAHHPDCFPPRWHRGRVPRRVNGRRPREEAVQGAGMSGPVQAQGAAESDASVRLWARSHVPGTRRDRAPADEAGIKQAKPPVETPSVGIRLWAVFQRDSAHEPSPENVGRGRDAVA